MTINYYVHPQGIVDDGANIGPKTKIWAFAHVLPGAIIGEDCNICDGVFIENDVKIGDRVTIKCGVQIWDGVTLENDVFIGPNATFTNDPFPRSKHYPDVYPRTLVCQGASIGANATILPGLTIGKNAMIGAGAVVTHDIPPDAVVTGNPARIRRYLDQDNYPLPKLANNIVDSRRIDKCQIIQLPKIADPRGNLTFIEGTHHIPFEIKRVYFLYDVPGGAERGGHAHKALHQFIIAMSGSFDVILDDGYVKKSIHLNRSYYGLYICPMIWREINNFSSGAVCMALVSEYFLEADYYRDYSNFLHTIKG